MKSAQHKILSLSVCRVWLTVLPLLATSLTQAATLDIKLSDGTHNWEWNPTIIETGNGGGKVNDITYNPLGVSLFCYNMTLDYDPFFSTSFDIVNNTAAVQNYSLTFFVPIAPPIPGGTLMGGSVQAGITDANFDGVGTLSTVGPGTALYNGQIDGVSVLPLFSNLKTITVPFQGGSTNESTSLGLPGVTIPGPAALATIGIKHEFSLTPGDRATFSSFFVVTPVIPEPGSLSLLAIGGLMLVCRRRR